MIKSIDKGAAKMIKLNSYKASTANRNESNSPLSLFSYNASSLISHSKRTELHTILSVMNYPKIIMLTETKLTENVKDAELRLIDYKIFRKDKTPHSGGVLIAVHNSIKVTKVRNMDIENFDALWVKIEYLDVSGLRDKIVLGRVYRHNCSDRNSLEGLNSCLKKLRKRNSVD